MPALWITESDGTLRLVLNQPRSAASRIHLEYLDEGGANIIFAIIAEGDDACSRHIKVKLLRLRKQTATGSASALDQLDAYKRNIAPLFEPTELLEYEVLALEKGALGALNDYLQVTARPANRRTDAIAINEDFGMLITDMRPQHGDTMLQIKPKWLSQSPTAPIGSRRCRTCALRAQRAAQKVQTATDAQPLCPLDLVSDDKSIRFAAACLLTADIYLQKHISNDLYAMLRRLQTQQQVSDPQGAMEVMTENGIDALCQAMTLRDCTLYVLKKADRSVEARLGDLDSKSPKKLERWREVERSLIDEGFYLDPEHTEKACALSRMLA